MPVSALFPRPLAPDHAAIGGLVVAYMVMTLLPFPANAQSVKVGARTGPTFGFLNDSVPPFFRTGEGTGTNTNMRLDLHGGAYAVVPLGRRFGLQGELLYLRAGGHISRSGRTSYRAEQYQLSYLQGQALGRRAISVPGPLSLHVVAGLTLKRLLAGTVRRDVHTPDQRRRENVDLQAQSLVREWDVGGLVGIGVSYPTGAMGRIALELRYNRGIRSVFTQRGRSPDQKLGVFEDPPPLTRAPPALRHDLLTASIAYTVPFRR